MDYRTRSAVGLIWRNFLICGYMVNFILPSFCIGCGKLGDNICHTCKGKISIIDFPICLVCENLCIDGKPHKACRRSLGGTLPDQLLVPFAYRKIVKKIILKSKHGSNSYKLLDILLSHNYNLKTLTGFPTFDLIVPVPQTSQLFSRRLINHSFYIAKWLEKSLALPQDTAIELLTKSGLKQKALSRRKRLEGIKGKISIPGRKPTSSILSNKSILLVDDITTTGATFIESSKILKENGAGKIYCYALAKEL